MNDSAHASAQHHSTWRGTETDGFEIVDPVRRVDGLSSTSDGLALDEHGFESFGRTLAFLHFCQALSAAFALLAAWDAEVQCLSKEMYYMLDLMDDDQIDISYISILSERHECVQMFRSIILPAALVVVVLSAGSFFAIIWYLGRIAQNRTEDLRFSFSFLLRLLLPVLIALASWTYATLVIMIRPKQSSEDVGRNPYNNLAAVDQWGRIGDNANLFYLSWLSEILALTIVYMVVVESFRLWSKASSWNRKLEYPEEAPEGSAALVTPYQLQAILSITSVANMQFQFQERRRKWYRQMLQFRLRSGFWTAAFVGSAVIFASSGHLFYKTLVKRAIGASGEDFEFYEGQRVCAVLGNDESSEGAFCDRTFFAVVTGVMGMLLALLSVILHLFVRRRVGQDMIDNALPGKELLRHSHLALSSEALVSFFLSILMGFNAIYATGVQGPAWRVGNLYYASWVSFLVSLRLCLGCLEELYSVEIEPSNSDVGLPTKVSDDGSRSGILLRASSDIGANERPPRLRRFFSLAICSMVCCLSAFDAGFHQDGALSPSQKYMVWSPAIVGLLSLVMFLLCLAKRSYNVVAGFCVGGIVSIACFALWLCDLVLTMHSEDSWAVNSIGEIKAANLYYFSWASIIAAGLQMMSYLKPYLGDKAKDPMVLVWGGIVKVCFVMIGATLHVWHKVSPNCGDAENEGGAITFCSRTICAFAIGGVGVFSGYLIIGMRVVKQPTSERLRIHMEAIVSIFLVLLFGVAVALITSIGGPGQSVGDLYYSTWLGFATSTGICIRCYDQMNRVEMQNEMTSVRDVGSDLSEKHIDIREIT